MNKRNKKYLLFIGAVLLCLTLTGALSASKTLASDSTASTVRICSTDITDGQYLANGSEEPTTEKPEGTGYVYYKDGILTLCNAMINTDSTSYTRVGIWANGDITINVTGNNQIGATETSSSSSTFNTEIGIFCSESTVYADECKDITLTGDGTLSIYDLDQGISGKNITIDMTGCLKIIEYGTSGKMPECCIKANDGDITIVDGTIILDSYVSYCMYGNNITITGGSIEMYSSSTGGSDAINTTPSFNGSNPIVKCGSGKDTATDWNGTDTFDGVHYISVQHITASETVTPIPSSEPSAEPSGSILPVVSPTSPAQATLTPELQPTTVPATDTSINTKPEKSKILKIKTAKKKATLKLKKIKGVTGYQIQYSTSKKFKKADKVTTQKANLIIKKLKTGKKYYFRVRTYKLQDGKKIYSSWSSAKKSKKIK